MKTTKIRNQLLVLSIILLSLIILNSADSKEVSNTKEIDELSKKVETLELKMQTSLEHNEKIIQTKIELTQAIANEAKTRTEVANYWLNLITIFLSAITLMTVVIPFILQSESPLTL
ncbi:hypothetical protein ACIDE9_08220 [Methylophilus sp. 'Pure River']|uniref:hypothetical protein n=1 Tax=Methylophilus sp. 'Pure River' TaxID=3377117 RepID=UPI00398EA813